MVDSVHGKTIHLDNGLVKKRDMLLKVHTDTVRRTYHVTQKITKEKKGERVLKKEGIDERNLISGQRR